MGIHIRVSEQELQFLFRFHEDLKRAHDRLEENPAAHQKRCLISLPVDTRRCAPHKIYYNECHLCSRDGEL